MRPTEYELVSNLVETALCLISFTVSEALHRENYRCIVTGRCDLDAIRTNRAVCQQSEGYNTVDAVHISPFLLVPDSDIDDQRVVGRLAAWYTSELTMASLYSSSDPALFGR